MAGEPEHVGHLRLILCLFHVPFLMSHFVTRSLVLLLISCAPYGFWVLILSQVPGLQIFSPILSVASSRY